MENRNEMTLNDVLNEFVAENHQPMAEALDEWVRRYPQYRWDLIDFAAAWAEQLVLPPEPELGPEVEKTLIDRAMSYVLNLAYDRDEHTKRLAESHDPVVSLTGEALRVGMNAQDFAKACGLDLVLIGKLNNRQIQPQTIPSQLVNNIGRLLLKPAAAITAYLALAPRAIAGKAFHARVKPASAGQQNFADAVRASSLSEGQKKRWLNKAAGEEEG